MAVSKFTRLGVLVAVIGGCALLPASTSFGGPPKVDGSHYTVTCNAVLGTFAFSPPVQFGGTLGPVKLTVKETLNGCIATAPPTAGPPPPSIAVAGGTVTGSLMTPSNDCFALENNPVLTGSLTVKWKTTPALTNSVSIYSPKVLGGGQEAASWGVQYSRFDFQGAGSTVSGPFAGLDTGATSKVFNETSQDIATNFNGCNSTPGLKKMNVGVGQFHLG
jgi:hypothetical protein